MTRYAYQVRDASGALSTGVLEAPDLAEASRALRAEGHVIVDLREHTGQADPAAGDPRPGRVKREQIIFFANQLAVMVDTGVPLSDALESMLEQTSSDAFRYVLRDLSDQVKSGQDFSTALARHPKLFSNLFVAMIRASEASGTMGKMLQRVAEYLDQQRRIRRQVKGAAAYPLAMLCFCIVVVTCMLVFVLPRFEKIYAGKSAVLPLPTRMLLALSGAIVGYWPLILGGLALVAVGSYLYFRRPEGKILLDRFRVYAPVLGKMYRKACLARSVRTLATMISSGVGMLEAMDIAAAVSGNTLYARIWTDLGARLEQGASLSEEMSRYPLIPRSVGHMVAAGERTGRLALVLERVAQFCEDELSVSIKTVTGFIEPIMIVVMGIIVGGIALALLLPVFSLSKVVAAG